MRRMASLIIYVVNLQLCIFVIHEECVGNLSPATQLPFQFIQLLLFLKIMHLQESFHFNFNLS